MTDGFPYLPVEISFILFPAFFMFSAFQYPHILPERFFPRIACLFLKHRVGVEDCPVRFSDDKDFCSLFDCCYQPFPLFFNQHPLMAYFPEPFCGSREFSGTFMKCAFQTVAMAFEFQMGLHSGVDGDRVDRLGDIIHRAQFKALGLVDLFSHYRDEYYGDIPGPFIGFQPLADFISIHI